MSVNYKIMFTYRKENGDIEFGTTEVTTDEPIKNVDDLREVSRTIGLMHGYTQVAINSTIPPMENIDDILSGVTTDSFGRMKHVESEGDNDA